MQDLGVLFRSGYRIWYYVKHGVSGVGIASSG